MRPLGGKAIERQRKERLAQAEHQNRWDSVAQCESGFWCFSQQRNGLVAQLQSHGPSISQWPQSIPSPGQDAEQDANYFRPLG